MGEETTKRKAQLRWLFRNVPPVDGKPASAPNAVTWMAANGEVEIGAQHLANIRAGTRGATHEVLVGLARYFGIPGDFWDDEEVEQAVRLDVALIGEAATSLRRRLVTATSTLDTQKLEQLEAAIEELRRGHDGS